jgi:UDP-N-acetylmuramoyl-L-alanyl-D-glutamate--2,6-diaminopimelate ligase
MSIRSLIKKLIPTSLFHKVEPTGHLLEAVLAQTMAGFPAKNIKFIGVTGTNGKTSTSFMIQRMMHEAGYKVGLMTTVAYGVGDNIKPQIAHMTTAGPKILLDRIKKMKNDGAEWIVLETTSHALAQRRVWGIPYSIAVFTNLTHEHLDYHGTFERYRDAKRLLFKQTDVNKQGMRLGVVNAEDPSAEYFASDITNVISYGLKQGDLRARNVKLTAGGSRYEAVIDGDEYRIECRLPGSFNVANSLAAVAVGRSLGLTKQQIEKGIAALDRVEGRMDPIDEGQNFSVIVDYAHTPDSFEKLFKDLRPVVKGKLIVLFGSAGRRDEAKRTTQGQLAGKYADEVVVTEEDDRDIDGQEIMEAIAKGAESEGKIRNKNLFLVHDRPDAIKFAFERAEQGDVVLLLGKGHEKDILRNGPRAAELRHLPQDDHNPDRVVEIPWDEISVARQTLKDLLD